MIRHPTCKKGNIYLSGGMEHAEELGGAWREKCSIALKTMGYFPLDITELDIEYQKRHGNIMGDIRFDTTESENQRKANIRCHFVEADLKLIENNSDALVVLYDESVRRGAGTISECQHAFNLDIPIFIVSAWKDWKTEVPSWLHAISTKIFTSFKDLYEYLDELPPGVLVRDQYGNHSSGNYYLCSLTGEVFEKTSQHFVSKVSPLYCKEAVEVVRHTYEDMKNRYEFFVEYYMEQKEE